MYCDDAGSTESDVLLCSGVTGMNLSLDLMPLTSRLDIFPNLWSMQSKRLFAFPQTLSCNAVIPHLHVIPERNEAVSNSCMCFCWWLQMRIFLNGIDNQYLDLYAVYLLFKKTKIIDYCSTVLNFEVLYWWGEASYNPSDPDQEQKLVKPEKRCYNKEWHILK